MKLYVIFLFMMQFLMINIIAQDPVLLIIGTRPDCIKMAPVYHALKQLNIPTVICSTDQHTDLLQDALNLFNLVPDFKLNVMKPNQDLFHITTTVLTQIKELCIKIKPALVLVQGDTTSALAAALAAFYLKIPVGHVEAGLRTYNIHAPYPEEFNRRVISLIASYHFAPTIRAKNYLLTENISHRSVFNVGNPVVDALQHVQQQIAQKKIMPSKELIEKIAQAQQEHKKIIILTAHRRESFPHGLRSIFSAIKQALECYPNLFIIYPTHPNPIVKEVLHEVCLENMPNILITKPVSYIDMTYLLSMADAVATDSGGLQEEAISLGKPVLVLRNETERYEGVEAGIAQLVGDDEAKIIQAIGKIMQTARTQNLANNIYGNGDAGQQIAHIIKNYVSTPYR